MPSAEPDSVPSSSNDWTNESEDYGLACMRSPLLVLSPLSFVEIFVYKYTVDFNELIEILDFDSTRTHSLFLVLTVVAFNVFGDVVRDVLDPQEEVA